MCFIEAMLYLAVAYYLVRWLFIIFLRKSSIYNLHDV